jgi:hypothetical protein
MNENRIYHAKYVHVCGPFNVASEEVTNITHLPSLLFGALMHSGKDVAFVAAPVLATVFLYMGAAPS